MELSSDDEGRSRPAPAGQKPKAPKRITFKDFRFGRTKSTPPNSIYSISSSPNPKPRPVFEEDDEDDEEDVRSRGPLVRSRSDEVGVRCRDEWAEGILAQDGLQESFLALRASVAEYEKEATVQQWQDLLKIHGDMRELGQLAESSQKNSRSGKETEDSDSGLGKFSAVAFEYSKLLDVVMNQSPEYAALAWGAIKFLLVAHVNHTKLKQSVQHYLVEFGRQFGVVNQIMISLPSSKMLEAVAEAYSALSKFLAKAVKYYRESKLMSALKAFGFPWETRFQVLVNQIEHAFKRIRDLASAGHFNVAVQSQNMLRTISHEQQTIRHEMHQDSVNLRKQLKDELKDEVRLLFDSFDKNWIQKFEHILESATTIPALPAAGSDVRALPNTGSATLPMIMPSEETGLLALSPPEPVAAVEYADSIVAGKPPIDTTVALQNVTFLADHIDNPKRLRRFRDRCFPLLQQIDHDDARLSALFKHLTQMDLQQSMGLLRHEAVRSWIATNHSSLLWVNTQKVYGIADWASSFSTKIIEYAGKIEYIMVLHHFCGNHPPSKPISTVTVAIQSMIMQILQYHHKKFTSRKVFPFTLEHFEDASGDLHELWDLLLSCIAETDLKCVWLVIDNIDNLQKGTDWEFFVSTLQGLSEEESTLFKIFVTARGTGTEARSGIEKALSDMSYNDQNDSRVSVVTVPRAVSRINNALYERNKRPARLPDHEEAVEPATKADIDALLDSGSDDEPWEDKKTSEATSHLVASPVSIKSDKIGRSSDSDESSLSDSSLDFMKDDPLASSAESDWEKDSNDSLGGIGDLELQDSDENFLTIARPKKTAKDVLDSDSSSDEEGPKAARKMKAVKKAPNSKAKGKKAVNSKKDACPIAKSTSPILKYAVNKAGFASSDSYHPVSKAVGRKGTFDTSESESGDEYGYI